MSHFWVQGAEQKWTAHALKAPSHDARAFLLPGDAGSSASPDESGLAIRALAFRQGAVERWAVVAGPYARLQVNGMPLTAQGMHVLADRDEISCAGLGSIFFSTETLAAVVEFPGADRPVYCGRCRQVIMPGGPSVRCPNCGVWYHEGETLKCHSYAETCAFCPYPTALDAGYTWKPEE
jgi:hypothetical protein